MAPVAGLSTSTSAPGSTAPLGSLTTPLIAPVAEPCPNAHAGTNKQTKKNTRRRLIVVLLIFYSPMGPTPEVARDTQINFVVSAERLTTSTAYGRLMLRISLPVKSKL